MALTYVTPVGYVPDLWAVRFEETDLGLITITSDRAVRRTSLNWPELLGPATWFDTLDTDVGNFDHRWVRIM